MKNSNVLELCLAHGLGGLEMFVASCYEEFSQKTTCKVVVAPDTKLDNYLMVADKFHIKRNKLFPFFPAWKLARYIDEQEIDIVHFHWTKDMLTAVLAKLFSKRKPRLVQSRHMRMTRFKNDFYHKWLYKNIDMMHAVTQDVANQLKKFIPFRVRPQIEMIYLGVKVPKIESAKVAELKNRYGLTDKFVVGIVGRIEEGKGQYKVLEALEKLKNANIKAVIVGAFMNDIYKKELQLLLEELGIKEQVIFTGFTKDVNEHMQLFDVNILATENETFGLVVIEAMANKVPIIATNRGGPTEIIEDGIDGMLFDGSSDDLAQKIDMLYKSQKLKEALIERAFLKVTKQFDYTKQLEKLYKSIQECK